MRALKDEEGMVHKGRRRACWTAIQLLVHETPRRGQGPESQGNAAVAFNIMSQDKIVKVMAVLQNSLMVSERAQQQPSIKAPCLCVGLENSFHCLLSPIRLGSCCLRVEISSTSVLGPAG